jgi:hypothetical protein
VKRWELGSVQDRAMDELIRLKSEPATAKQNLEAVERQTNQPPISSEVVKYTAYTRMRMDDKDIRESAIVQEEEILAA